uniref:WAPL domain-containing protein n=1 Tax=Globodera pallida TaxID=36090 RepID=A0A183BP16_GLOPA
MEIRGFFFVCRTKSRVCVRTEQFAIARVICSLIVWQATTKTSSSVSGNMPSLVGRALPLGWNILCANTSWRSTSRLLQCRTANILWQTKRGLRSDMYDEIDEENEETECPRSFDHLLKSTKLVKGQRMELSEFYKANNAKQGLDMLNTLIATDQLNHKLLLDGVKLLALKFASGQCQDGEDNHVRVAVLRKLCDEKLGDNEHIAATVALLLDGCEGRWDRLRPLLAKAVFKTDCFHLLAGMALARHQLNTLE